MNPKVLDRVQVRALGRPLQNFYPGIFEPPHRQLWSVFWIIILLEDEAVPGRKFWFGCDLLDRWHQGVFQYIDMLLGIHSANDLDQSSDPWPCHRAPHHNRAATKLNSRLDYPVAQCGAAPDPAVL